MNKDSFLLQVVAENVEKQKAIEAEKRKSYTSWLGPHSYLFIENFFPVWKAKRSQAEHEAILHKYTNQTEPKLSLQSS